MKWQRIGAKIGKECWQRNGSRWTLGSEKNIDKERASEVPNIGSTGGCKIIACQRYAMSFQKLLI